MVLSRRGKRSIQEPKNVVERIERFDAGEGGSVVFASRDQYATALEPRRGGSGARRHHRPYKRPLLRHRIIDFGNIRGCSSAQTAARHQHASVFERGAYMIGVCGRHGSHSVESAGGVEYLRCVQNAGGIFTAGNQNAAIGKLDRTGASPGALHFAHGYPSIAGSLRLETVQKNTERECQ